MKDSEYKSDIIERTSRFAIGVMNYLKTVKVTIYNSNIVKQLLRSSSSIGANYCEARESTTKNDFRNKANISKKEAKETIFWLELLENDQDCTCSLIRRHKYALCVIPNLFRDLYVT